MKLFAIKKSDGKIWLARGDYSRAMEAGDSLIEIPDNWTRPNRFFRNEWKEENGQIVVDMVSARAKKMEKIREERNSLLTASDAEYVKLLSMGSDLTAINTLKQSLRNLPASAQIAIDWISDADSLEAYEPAWP